MGKLTKAQRRELEMALSEIQRQNDFIYRPEIEFCRVTEYNAQVPQGPMEYRAREPHRSQHYTGRDGLEWDIDYIQSLTPMEKGIGSDLVAGHTAIKILQRFLENN